jgi:hypothetical protein
VAELLLLTHWSWAELQETPAEVVDAVVDALNRSRGVGTPPPESDW